uniref:Odorant receptor n=1 Tax=Subpsaltria yangi TaxID=1195109 RepID=A0A385IUS9_9HEMI|nr:odorant receptor 2 [Subpsaltria yangi]
MKVPYKKLFSKPLYYCGIDLRNDSTVSLTFYVFVVEISLMISLVSVSINLFTMESDDLNDLIEACNDLNILFFSILLYNSVIINYKSFSELLNILEKELYEYKSQNFNKAAIDKEFKKKNKVVFYGLSMSIGISVIGKWILPLLNVCIKLLFGNISSEMLALNFPFSYWYPYEMTIVTYIPTYICLSFPSVYLGMNVYTTCLLFCTGCVYICYNLKLLSLAVMEIDRRSKHYMFNTQASSFNNRGLENNFSGQITEEKFYPCLAECIEHHHSILKCMKILGNSLSPAVHCCNHSTVFHLSLIVFYLSTEGTNVNGTYIKFVTMLIGVAFLFWFCSYFGQQVIDEAEKYHFALYCAHWVDKTESFKRTLRVMMTFANRGLYLKAIGVYVIGLSSFCTVVQAAYSYFNLISSVKDKSN